MCCQLCHKGGKPPQGRNQPENDQVDDLYIMIIMVMVIIKAIIMMTMI